MESFTVELAGVPVGIKCRFPANRAFLRDYISEKAPRFIVRPDEDDLRKAQSDFDRVNGEHISYADDFLENTAIHALLAERLVHCNVLLMHGSALCMDGEAVVFTAPSGTGKSTHARLWREAFGQRVWMINDDKPLLRITDDGITVYGTPWDGKHRLSKNASAPLKAIVRLQRGAENRIAPLSRAEAFQVLLRQAYTSENPDTMKAIAALEAKLVKQSKFYNLSCNMQREAALTARRGICTGTPCEQRVCQI